MLKLPHVIEMSAEHPVVRVHPETGRRWLYVTRMWTSHIPQLSRHESDAVLQHLFEHSERPSFHCRYRWEPDLFKVDVEGAELEVLEGLDLLDWWRVRQCVLEVHDLDCPLGRGLGLLDAHGFAATTERARHPGRCAAIAGVRHAVVRPHATWVAVDAKEVALPWFSFGDC